MRNAASILSLALFTSTVALPGNALPSTCRPEYGNLSGGLVHTACKPPNDNCVFVTTGLNMAEKAEVLKAHNDFRSQVAQGRLHGFPAASNMYRLRWDEELAQVAQAFTNLCDDRHDKEPQRKTSKFPKVGQNIAWNYEPKDTRVIDSAGRVRDWFEEYKDFSASNVDPFRVNPGPVVTHFTQVAWADTRYIGCGYTHYKLRNDNDPRLPYKKLYVCNYAPGGNLIGKSMYKTGAPCSACPAGTVCDAPTGLCAEDEYSYNKTLEPRPYENITTLEPITKAEDENNYSKTLVPRPHENITTVEPITKTENITSKYSQELPPLKYTTTVEPTNQVTKVFTPGESDGLGGADSGGSSGSQWGVLAFFLLGIFAMTTVGIGLLYVRSVAMRSRDPAREPCAL